MADSAQYLSEASLEALKIEFEKLKNQTIPEISKRIDEAKQQGDLSENAEYHQAREEMSWAQGKLKEMERIINNAKIIVKVKTGVVAVGSTILVKVGDNTKEYRIVGPQEINPSKGLISNESPLGEAFIGHEVGDSVEVSVPSGKITYKILKIS